MAPVFGDFLAQAQDHVTAAVSVQEELSDEASNGVIRELDRLITILARYLGDMALAGSSLKARRDKVPPGECARSLMRGSRCAAPLRSCMLRPAR
jgi:hypothetical protein